MGSEMCIRDRACAIANLIIDKNLKETGIITLEELGTNQNYFDYITNYLDRKEISINFSDGGNFLEKE